MRTQALRVTIGAHDDRAWHASIIMDIYERGMIKDSRLVWGPIYASWPVIQDRVLDAMHELRRIEMDRLHLPAAG